VRIRVLKGFWTSGFGLTVLGVVFAIFLTTLSLFAYFYIKYSRMIDARLSGHVLQNTTQIFSAPEHISVGQAISPAELITYLQRAGYRLDADPNELGQYTAQRNSVDIRPSKLSYFAGGNALDVQFTGNTIRSIRPLGGGTASDSAEIEPELITNLSTAPAKSAARSATTIFRLFSCMPFSPRKTSASLSTVDLILCASLARRGPICAIPAATFRAPAPSPCKWHVPFL